jgi:hypothetical protein
MPINEQKLRDILAEQEANIKRHVSEHETNIKRHAEEQGADIKRHVGVLVEENDRKFDIVHEGYRRLRHKVDRCGEELAGIRKEIEEIRMHLFRKADLDRLEAVENAWTQSRSGFSEDNLYRRAAADSTP